MMHSMPRIPYNILFAFSAAAILLSFAACNSAQKHSDSTTLTSSDNGAKRVLQCAGRSKGNIAITLTAAISNHDSLQLKVIDSPRRVDPLSLELQRGKSNKGTMAVYFLPIDESEDPDVRFHGASFSFPIEILNTSIPDYSKTFKGIYNHTLRDLDIPVPGYGIDIDDAELVCHFSRSSRI